MMKLIVLLFSVALLGQEIVQAPKITSEHATGYWKIRAKQFELER